MMNVILETDELIDVLSNTDFVKNMINLRKKIIDENITISRDDKIVNEYISNQNIFDYHIYYLNSEINKLINNKVCRSNHESN